MGCLFPLDFVIPISLPAISYGDLEKPLHGKLFASLTVQGPMGGKTREAIAGPRRRNMRVSRHSRILIWNA
jgi:hypothetical protein